MAAPASQSASLPQVFFRRPLLDVSTAAAALDKWAWQIERLIDTGDLRWAFDLARQGSGKRCVRILARSLADYQQGRQSLRGEEFGQVFHQIFPACTTARDGTLTVRATTAARRFNCKHAHVYQLVADGLLTALKGSRRQPGPLGSQAICLSSLADFLKSRRLA